MKNPKKDIISIVIRLTVTCLLAGLVMGITYIFTSDAKRQNEYNRQVQVMYSLLGYDSTKPVPNSVSMHSLYRYIIDEEGKQSIAYLVPAKSGDFLFIILNLDGELIEKKSVKLDASKANDANERNRAILSLLSSKQKARFADSFQIVTEDGKRIAYLLEGKFPGFKTHIAVMIALKSNFEIQGIEILSHEEDPGLGAEIVENYFKRQFQGIGYERLLSLEVIRDPLPDDYAMALETPIVNDESGKVLEKHKNDDIYAITGATISSKAVSDGVKSTVKKFVYRLETLDKVLNSQRIESAFSEGLTP